jgi:hypothetical protein
MIVPLLRCKGRRLRQVNSQRPSRIAGYCKYADLTFLAAMNSTCKGREGCIDPIVRRGLWA